MRYNHWMTLAGALVLFNAACTIDQARDEGRGGAREAYAQAAPAAPNLVTVTASEFTFDAPATIPAGLTTVRLVNEGREMHHVQLVRLEEGHTVEELMQGEHGPMPAWAHFVGGPNVPAPDGFTEATMELQAGNYALLCFIPSPDGVPHLMKGMVKPLTVVPSRRPAAARLSDADVTLTLSDYAYDITPEITAGRRTIRVRNAAAQPHEVVLLRLAPGKTPQDVMEWERKQEGPPPAVPMGGTSLLSTGEENQITADFTPGEYALLCFVPDAGDGRPHVAHGMVRQITVR